MMARKACTSRASEGALSWCDECRDAESQCGHDAHSDSRPAHCRYTSAHLNSRAGASQVSVVVAVQIVRRRTASPSGQTMPALLRIRLVALAYVAAYSKPSNTNSNRLHSALTPLPTTLTA